MPNERLVECDLARRLSVGRAAVRTALVRLEQEGIVEREPFRGAHVRSVSEAEAIEILEAQAALEGLAARHAAVNASNDDVAALRSIVERMRRGLAEGDLLEMSDLGNQIHRRLLEISKHQTAARMIDVLQAQVVRYQYRTILFPGRAPLSLEEHHAIVEAVASHDPEAAEAAMRSHVAHVGEALRRGTNVPLDRTGNVT